MLRRVHQLGGYLLGMNLFVLDAGGLNRRSGVLLGFLLELGQRQRAHVALDAPQGHALVKDVDARDFLLA
jgi:hypothetical protein